MVSRHLGPLGKDSRGLDVYRNSLDTLEGRTPTSFYAFYASVDGFRGFCTNCSQQHLRRWYRYQPVGSREEDKMIKTPDTAYNIDR